MKDIKDLQELIRNMDPELTGTELIFASFPGTRYGDLESLQPISMVLEEEGMTLVLEKSLAERAGIEYDGVFRQIVLRVHSPLEAVGLTAVVANAFAVAGISANVIAGHYHDHVFVPSSRAEEALSILQSLAAQTGQESM